MGKGVVVMHKGGGAITRLPIAVTENKIPIVPWNQKELAKAIKKQSENR